jgi:hypothetical protein
VASIMAPAGSKEVVWHDVIRWNCNFQCDQKIEWLCSWVVQVDQSTFAEMRLGGCALGLSACRKDFVAPHVLSYFSFSFSEMNCCSIFYIAV